MCCECNEATEKKEKNILNHTENYFEIFRNFKLKKCNFNVKRSCTLPNK